jgi:hypothetical protein
MTHANKWVFHRRIVRLNPFAELICQAVAAIRRAYAAAMVEDRVFSLSPGNIRGGITKLYKRSACVPKKPAACNDSGGLRNLCHTLEVMSKLARSRSRSSKIVMRECRADEFVIVQQAPIMLGELPGTKPENDSERQHGGRT